MLGLEAAGDARAAPEGDHNGVLLERGAQDGRHLLLGARAQHHIGQPAKLAAPLPDQIGEALSAGMDDAIAVFCRDILAPDGILELSAQPVRDPRCGNLQLIECDGSGGGPADVEPELALDEGRQLGLALVAE